MEERNLAHGPLNREELQDLLEAPMPHKKSLQENDGRVGGDDWKDPIFLGGVGMNQDGLA